MVSYGIFWSGQLDDYNLQIKTGVLVCANMQDLMLTKLLTSLKSELKEEGCSLSYFSCPILV